MSESVSARRNPVSARCLIPSECEGSALSDLLDLRGLRRHHLLWVRPEYHPSITAQIDDATLRDVATDFLAAGWPLVMRRQSEVEDESPTRRRSIAAGMPLPPSQGKLRLALAVPPESIMRVAPPLTLGAVIRKLSLIRNLSRIPSNSNLSLIPSASEGPASQQHSHNLSLIPSASEGPASLEQQAPWRSLLSQLLHGAEAANIQFRVFGSAAWEALTGCSYLTAHSDIDLLWQPSDVSQIDAGIALLETWEAQAGLVADGEIQFGDDAAVAWREWRMTHERQSASRRILVKTLHGPRLSSRSELLALMSHCRAEPIKETAGT